MDNDNWGRLGDLRALERKVDEHRKNEAATIAHRALKVAKDLLYLNGCVARGRGTDIDPEYPGRNVFEYIKELEAKAGVVVSSS